MMEVTINIPATATIGDLTSVKGALFNASCDFVDWEAMANDSGYIPPAAVLILLSIAAQLEKHTR